MRISLLKAWKGPFGPFCGIDCVMGRSWTMDSTSHYKDAKMDRYGPFCLIGCVMGRRTRHSTSQYKDAEISLGDRLITFQVLHVVYKASVFVAKGPSNPAQNVHATYLHGAPTHRSLLMLMLCTPYTCTHLPKPVHAVHATCMHPFTQARACCAGHMHAPIYSSPCMMRTVH